jgi:hypothetical protein
MRKVVILSVLFCAAITLGCNATKQAGSTTSTTPTIGLNNAEGWTVTSGIAYCQGGVSSSSGCPGNYSSGPTQSTLQVVLVSSLCSVSTPIGSFTVQGSACVIADNNSKQGSVSGTGQLIYPPAGVLLGVVPPLTNEPGIVQVASSTPPVDFLSAEVDPSTGDAAVFSGQGYASYSSTGAWTINGTASCVTKTPVCSGVNIWFTATANLP